MAKSYTNTKVVTEGLSRLQKAMLGALFALIVTLGILTVLTIRSWLSEEQLNKETTQQYGSLTTLLDKSNFKAAYLKANGGTKMLDTLQTIRVSGWMDGNGPRRRFVSIKKRPDKALLTFDYENYSLSFGINGETAWQRTNQPGENPVIDILSGHAATALFESGKFYGPVMRGFLLGDGEISELKQSSWNGQECILATIDRGSEEAPIQVYVDPATMHPLARIEAFADGTVRKTVYRDYHDLGGMQEAFNVESYMNDVLQSRLIIESSDTNFGILSQLFDPPSVQEPLAN